MDAEGLGRKLLLTPSGDPRRAPEKQAVGTVTASHQMLTLQALSSSHNAGAAKRGHRAEERLLGALRQSVPQNGRVHLHIIDQTLRKTAGKQSKKVPSRPRAILPKCRGNNRNTARKTPEACKTAVFRAGCPAVFQHFPRDRSNLRNKNTLIISIL